MSIDGDHVYAHGTDVNLIKGCLADDGLDLLAVSGSHSVVVLSYVRAFIYSQYSISEARPLAILSLLSILVLLLLPLPGPHRPLLH